MLEYIIGSGIVCMASTQVLGAVLKHKFNKLGYVPILSEDKAKKRDFKERVLGFLCNFIPVINNIASLAFIGVASYVGFSSDEKVTYLFDKTSGIEKASRAKEIYDRRIKNHNFKAMEESMKIDGADKETIKREIDTAKKSCGIPNDKNMKKIEAMSDAELWLLDVEMSTDLSEQEKISLYRDYVKGFSSRKTNKKAVEKTLKMTNSMNR